MRLLNMLGIAVALQLVATPGMAQGTSDQNENAHHYQGGPKTVVPHSMKHPKSTNPKSTKGVATTGRSTGGHHYRGGPQNLFHHMGDNP
jgi:hypothetical protein